MRDDGYDAILHNRVDSLSLSDRSEQLLDWLEDYGVKDAWKLAEPLAVGGVEVATLDKLMERWRNDTTQMRDMGLRWLALSFDVMTMITSGLRGAKRMSELVGAMKSYSYMDRGVQQLIDIHEGLEDTLRLFAHKIKQGIEIRRAYDCNLPKILAYGSELNQVWTNLIDNAIDAIAENGAIKISTSCNNNTIQVQIADSGSGIPPEIQPLHFRAILYNKIGWQRIGFGIRGGAAGC